jgi:hypothetical protein
MMFLQLDAQNKIVGQRDEPPGHGNRPTTGWVAGEYLADPHDVTIDLATPPGAYQLEVGLYDPQTGQRVQTDAQTDPHLPGSTGPAHLPASRRLPRAERWPQSPSPLAGRGRVG